jgi:hypothetical protein
MVDQRLPAVGGDEGHWGEILNQFLQKEHYDTGSDNPANGGHQTITIRAGTASAGNAPLKFTSGTLLTTPEAGAMEFAGDNYYLTQTSNTTRKKIAAYDDSSGATGDVYYRNSGGYFTRLGIGSSNNLLGVSSGVPAWTSTISGATISGLSNTLSDIALSSVASSAYSTTPTANILAAWDGNANLLSNSFFPRANGILTSGGSTSLIVSSQQMQRAYGTSTHTIALPVTSVVAGNWWWIFNDSTGSVTVNASGGSTCVIMAPGTQATFVSNFTGPTTPSQWDVSYSATSVAGGKTLAVSNSLTFTGTDGTSMAFPAASDTVVGTAATQTLASKTLTNPTVNNYTEGVVSIGTVTTSNTLSLTNGTVQTATLTASTACTFTMPTATAGKSFVLFLKQPSSTGNGSATFTGVKWNAAGAPTTTATAGKMDILTFTSDGTNWYGSYSQGYTY